MSRSSAIAIVCVNKMDYLIQMVINKLTHSLTLAGSRFRLILMVKQTEIDIIQL